jgi:hypothetical protein
MSWTGASNATVPARMICSEAGDSVSVAVTEPCVTLSESARAAAGASSIAAATSEKKSFT